MKTKASKAVSALLITSAVFMSGMIHAQNNAPTPAAPNAMLAPTASMAKIIEMDREGIRQGWLPPEILQYDLQIAKLLPEGQEIMASRDPVKARIWSEKMDTLNRLKSQAMAKLAPGAVAQNAEAPSAPVNRTPDPCLSPMGVNTCTAPSRQQQSGTTYSAGPGGIGANVGGIPVGPGGIGGM